MAVKADIRVAVPNPTGTERRMCPDALDGCSSGHEYKRYRTAIAPCADFLFHDIVVENQIS